MCVTNLAYIQVTPGIRANPVGRPELEGKLVPRQGFAESGEAFSFKVVKSDTRAKIGKILHKRHGRRNFRNNDKLRFLLGYKKPARTEHIVPLGNIVSLVVKNLYSVIFPVCHINAALLIGTYRMGKAEFAGIRACTPPGEKQFSLA